MKSICLYSLSFFLLLSIAEKGVCQANKIGAEVFDYSKTSKGKSETSSYLDQLGLIDVGLLDPSIRTELKYASTDNFTGVVLYDDLRRAYLHPLAAKKLKQAQIILQKDNPELSLLVYDAARPLSVQKKMYDVVKNTKYRAYVADPSRTGLHNYGMAVDLTLCDSEGKPLDMGTKFDFFGKEARINNEDLFVTQGLLTKKQVENRRLLRRVMKQVGFIPIRGEWWHFNACSLQEAKAKYKVIE